MEVMRNKKKLNQILANLKEKTSNKSGVTYADESNLNYVIILGTVIC